MKKVIIAILAFVLITTGTIFIFAQKGDGRKFGGKGGFGERGLLMMAEKLNLSDEQKAQVKQILEDSKTRVQPVMESLRANHNEIKNLGTDGTYNEAEVTRLAGLQAELTKQLVIEKERTKAAVFAVLTPEQRTKATELRDQMKERFKDRFPRPFGGRGGFEGAEE